MRIGHSFKKIAPLQGWEVPTLRRVDGQWRIYSTSGNVFVPLDKAEPRLLDACPGARDLLNEEDSKPF